MLKEAPGIKKLVLSAGKTDMRLGIGKLAAMLQTDYGLNPMEDGGLYLFSGSRKDTIKALTYEDDGFLIMTKRMAGRVFQWPNNTKEALEISRESYERLMDGYRIETVLTTHELLKYGFHM